jgi:hypothetical protein
VGWGIRESPKPLSNRRTCPSCGISETVHNCGQSGRLHLAKARTRARQKKGLTDPGSREYLYAGELPESKHGRQPGTLQSLALNREDEGDSCGDWGLPAELAATALQAAKAALLGAHATLEKRTPYWRGNYWTKRTLANRIHRETRLAGIGFGWTGERIGKGIRGHPFLYFSGGK